MTEFKRILLAEDSEHDIELALEAFKAHKLSNPIDIVRDGAEALDYLFRQNKYADRETLNPALVLLDLKMPRVDGLEVLKKIKSDPRFKTIPVVMMTSSREEKDLGLCYGVGANAYVVKPVKFSDFQEAVGKVGIFWGLINEPPPLEASQELQN